METLKQEEKEIKKTQNINAVAQNKQKNKKKTTKLSKKSKYFDFYDDIKSSCHKIVDW